MHLPMAFFYEKRSSEVEYVNTPTQRMDVNRLVKGVPCYVKPSQKTVTERKKILIADWSMNAPHRFKEFKTMQNTLKQMLEEGFELFLWQDNTCVPLSLENLDNTLNGRFKTKYASIASDETMLSVMAKDHHISHDKVYIVDPHRAEFLKETYLTEAGQSDVDIDSCMDELDDMESTTLYLSDILLSRVTTNVTDAYKTSKQRVITIVNDVSTPQTYDASTAIQEALNDAKLEESEQQTVLLIEEQAFLEAIKHEPVIIDGFELNESTVSHLKCLIFLFDKRSSRDADSAARRQIVYKFLNGMPDHVHMIALQDPAQLSQVFNSQYVHLSHAADQIHAPNTPLTDPAHNASDKLNHQRTAGDFKFKFEGKNKSKNQKMISEKLSQYLTLKNTHTELIPKIQDGMCSALSTIFNDMPLDAWNQFVTTIHDWNGSASDLENNPHLINNFELLLKHYKKIYIKNKVRAENHYLGDALIQQLNTMHDGEKISLTNHWHQISINKINNNTWLIYDPNYVSGYKEIKSMPDLLDAIRASIGYLVSLCHPTLKIKPVIENRNEFLHAGGLHILCQSENLNEIVEALEKSPTTMPLQDAGLQTLLLRNMNAAPAWVCCLQSSDRRVNDYVLELLNQFINHYSDAYERLNNSLSGLNTFEKFDVLATLRSDKWRHASDITSTIANVFSAAIMQENIAAQHSHHKKLLATWESAENPHKSSKQFIQALLQPDDNKKILVKVKSHDAANMLSLLLEKHCADTKHPVFYVHSPDDLVCVAPRIMRNEDNTGKTEVGAGGALYDFLEANRNQLDPPPILIVNYDQFKLDDIVRLNSILDNERKIDGVMLPTEMKVIGIMNPNRSDAYQGSDFYSRFDNITDCPFDEAKLAKKIPAPLYSDQISDQATVINLYHASNWQERLFGHWIVNAGQLHFKEGALVNALKSGQPIEIQNGPWHDDKFRFFWDQAFARGYVSFQGKTIPLPADLVLIQTEGYDFDRLREKTSFHPSFSAEAPHVLNPACLTDFFHRYVYDDNQLVSRAGIVQEYANKALHVNVTRSLDNDEWAELFAECQKHNVTLHCHLSQNMSAAEETQDDTAFPTHTHDHTIIYPAEYLPLYKNTPACFIDVSECDPSDLLTATTGKFDPDTSAFVFTQKHSVVMDALNQGQTVILKGHFSAELADQLAALLLARMNTPNATGKLILLPENIEAFQYYPPSPLQEPPLAETLSFGESAREGMYDAPKITLSPFDPATSEDETLRFTQERLDSVNEMLAHEPYVYLTGLTAVGKTSFVSQELSKQPHTTLYQGEDQFLHWAKDTSSNRKILFIDEANITSRQWSEFEGLYHKPPGVLINGEYITLSDNHKVIFAGNPLSYGGERALAPLFEKHGNALLFKPMPLGFIYEKILRPVFKGIDEQATQDACKVFLNVYQLLCQLSKNEVLLSPREIQMMAIMTVSLCAQHKTVSLNAAAKHYAYLLAREWIPVHFKPVFDRRFQPQEHINRAHKEEADTENRFLITESRIRLSDHLNDLLRTREYKIGASDEEIKYGGLGGIVIEGEPGIGKSELVTHALINAGYEEVHWPHPHETNQPFYRMPVNMQLDDKKALLLHAFNEGAVVVVDEINSSPMMERLLNDLLMGRTPDGKRPDKPGFMIIGTQNPASMGGRQEASNALAHRLTTLVLPPYNTDEMRLILTQKGLSTSDAEALINAYEEQRSFAAANHLKPAPAFRDLLKLADHLMKGKTALKSQQAEPASAYSRFSLFKPLTPDKEASEPTIKSKKNR